MVEGPRAVPVDRIDELIQLCNRIFRSSGGDMGAEYPLVFDRGQPDNMRVILEDGKIVSHIGLCIRDASILGRTLRTASIGAVCTDPEHRNRGHAWALLNDCLIRSQEQGVHVILISGDRSLYRRFGGCRPGSFHQTEVAGAPLPAGLGLDLASPGDASTLVKLHQGESVRFIRPAHDWERLLRSGMLMNRSADCWIVRHDRRGGDAG